MTQDYYISVPIPVEMWEADNERAQQRIEALARYNVEQESGKAVASLERIGQTVKSKDYGRVIGLQVETVFHVTFVFS